MTARLRLALLESQDFSKSARDKMETLFDVSVFDSPQPPLEELFHNFDILWFRFGLQLPADRLKTFMSVRTRFFVIPVTCANHVDESQARRLGIELLTLKSENDFLKEIYATAELTLGLLLALLRHIPSSVEDAKKGNWNRDHFRGREIHGKTVGLIGVGRLGRMMASTLSALGARVLGFDLSPQKDLSGIEWLDLDTLLSRSDIISIHLSLNESTRKFMNSERFSLMKTGAYFVNTSRGEIVDETALLEALESKRLAGAALDVLDSEAIFSANHPLACYARKSSRLILSPHIGGNTFESFEKTEFFMLQKLTERLNQ